jgi:hypothetical protein
MEALKIELKNGYETISAIYHRDGNGSIFTYKATRRYMPVTVISIIVSVSPYAVATGFRKQAGFSFLFSVPPWNADRENNS